MRTSICAWLAYFEMAGLLLTGPAIAAVTFRNATPIVVPATGTEGAGSPFPSQIEVAGLPDVITGVSLTMHGLTHAFPDDLDILLVGPSGSDFVVQADAGGGADVSDLTYTLDDDAAAPLPNEAPGLTPGVWRPSAYAAGDFAAGGPSPPYAHPPTQGAAGFASVFAGGTPNGIWSLYVLDDAATDVGQIAGGWSITFETDPPSFGGAAVVISEIGPGAPWPATATVSGVREIESLRVTLYGVTHSYPDDLAVLVEAPSGDSLILQSGAGGIGDADAATYVFDDFGAALSDAAALPTGGAVVRPTSYADPDFEIAGGPAPPWAEPFPDGAATFASVFTGQRASGTWKLWVVDCCAPDGGSIDGFSLTVTPEADASALGAAVVALLALRARRR
jgi:subtilisin-like proprotein convertase family protein